MSISINAEAELYWSFAAAFHRPNAEVADNLEELVELLSEELPVFSDQLDELSEFCAKYPVGEERLNALWEQYIPLFETGRVEAPPYASVYLNSEGLVMGAESQAVQEFYEMAGYQVEQPILLPDHLAVELEFMALLLRDGDEGLAAEFRHKHLQPFLAGVLPRVKGAQRQFYSVLAQLLERWQFENLKKEGDLVD